MKKTTKINHKSFLERSLHIGAKPILVAVCFLLTPALAYNYAKKAMKKHGKEDFSNKWKLIWKETLPAFKMPFNLSSDIISGIYASGSEKLRLQEEKERAIAEAEHKKSVVYNICEFIKNSNDIKSAGFKTYLIKDGLMLIDIHSGVVSNKIGDVKIIRLTPKEMKLVSGVLQNRCAELMYKEKQR